MEYFKCDFCANKFLTRDELGVHKEEHSNVTSNNEIGCNKCDKKYANINKLRRHDWRVHREIDCNICGEKLNCRKDISVHRQSKHQMFRKIVCKFFPDCIDEDECFFEHSDLSLYSRGSSKNSYCNNGMYCFS